MVRTGTGLVLARPNDRGQGRANYSFDSMRTGIFRPSLIRPGQDNFRDEDDWFSEIKGPGHNDLIEVVSRSPGP